MNIKDLPKNAERLVLSECVGSENYTVPSKWLEGRMITKTKETYVCPCCYSDAEVPQHGVEDLCRNCNLKWVAFGNALYVWRSE